MKLGDTLYWTIIRGIDCYVLNHPKGKIKIVEIGDKFVVGYESITGYDRYKAAPKNKIITLEAFKCFQQDKEDLQSHIQQMFDKILRKA